MMLPTFDPDELAPYCYFAQRKYAKRLKGDLADRHRAEWQYWHNDDWLIFGRPSANVLRHRWDRWRSRVDFDSTLRLHPRYRGCHWEAQRLNRVVRRQVRAELKHSDDMDARQFERRMPWMD